MCNSQEAAPPSTSVSLTQTLKVPAGQEKVTSGPKSAILNLKRRQISSTFGLFGIYSQDLGGGGEEGLENTGVGTRCIGGLGWPLASHETKIEKRVLR